MTVQLPPDVDVELMLGVHKWALFINNYNGHIDGASVIFEYNWTMSGDPNNHELNLSSFDSWHSAVLLP